MKTIKLSLLLGFILIVYGLAFINFAPGYGMFFVRSESMKPGINIGDLVAVGPVNGIITGDVRPGAIITFELDSKTRITHRVVKVDGDKIQTKGDAVEEPDPFTATMSQVKGIYMFRIPFVGYLTAFIRTRIGWYVSIIIPAMLLVGWIIKDIIKEALKGSSYY